MRLRSLLFATVIASLALVVPSSRAVAQADAAKKTTIRIITSTNPVAPADVPAPQPTEPPALELPTLPTESTPQLEPQLEPELLQQPESIQHPEIKSPVVARPAPIQRPLPTAPQYPVRQATYAAPTSAPTLVHAPNAGHAPSMVNVYSSANAQATLRKMPGPAPVQSRPAAQRSHQPGKPFQSVLQSEPAISPYLNMYRNDANANSLPNYLAYVRPQLDQQEANRQQTAEIQKLRGQLQNMSSSGSAPPTSANMTAHAHYMDTAQFYRNTRR